MQNNTIRWILIGLLAVTGLYVIVDHGQHLAPYVPFAFLLGCLVMHLFMHGSHGGNNHSHHQDGENKSL